MRNKIFLLIAIVFMPISYLLANGVELDGICYLLNKDSLTAAVTYTGTSSYSGNTYAGDIAIPSTVEYRGKTYNVTSIGGGAFYDCSSLISIEIPNNVTTIGKSAFYGCNGLTSIEIPNSVTSIGEDAFKFCSNLSSIKIPNGVTSIGDWTFTYCRSLTSIKIPNSVTSIGNYAFEDCSSLTSIEIPNSVTSIGYFAFEGCSSLPVVDNIRYADTYSVEVVDSSLSTYHIQETTRWIGDFNFSNCENLTSIEIPNSVTSIGEAAFSGCSSLTSIEIPNSVTTIGYQTFYGCSSLSSIEIPNSVTSIGYYAFSGCSSITSIEIPNSVTSIDYRAFDGCSSLTSVIWNVKNHMGFWSFNDNTETITSFVFGDDVESVPAHMCKNMSNLKYVKIGKNVTSIGDEAFSGCSSLTSIEIPNSVTSIGEAAFKDCAGLTTINLSENITTISDGTFDGCDNLPVTDNIRYADTYLIRAIDTTQSSYYIKEGTKWIGPSAFKGCVNIKSMEFPNSVTSLGSGAFKNCKKLQKLVLGDQIVSIGYDAFYACQNLWNITAYMANPPAIARNVFSGNFYDDLSDLDLYVLESAAGKYRNADVWKEFNIIPITASSDNVAALDLTTDENTVTIKWPAAENAESYELTIRDENGSTVSRLTFDAEGKLTDVRYKKPSIRIPQREESNGFEYTIGNLEKGKTYTYSLVAKDANNETVKSYTGDFHINIATNFETLPIDNLSTTLANPEVMIYNVNGMEVTTLRDNLPQGVYILRLGNQAAKVQIR